MKTMSLRGVINLRILTSALAIVILGVVLAIWQARESVREEVNSSYNLALQMLEFGLNQFTRDEHSESEWLEQISRLRETRHLQIKLFDKKGHETNLTHNTARHYKDIPPQWFIDAVMIKPVSSSYDITLPHDAMQRIVISADPMDEIAEAWNESLVYFWSILLMLSIIFFAINVVFHSMLKTVQAILFGLKDVEKGNYEQQLPRFRITEFDAIADEVNNLTQALKAEKQNNQALARHTMQIQETERRHMSRELHDEMGQSLTAVKAMSVAAKHPTADINDIADTIIGICNHLSGVVRSMMRTLHPLSLSDLGLLATLTDLVSEWQRRQPGLAIHLNYAHDIDVLDDEVAIHVYRIVQECITNVVRHAKATQANITITKQGADTVHLQIKDNGQGGVSSGEGFGVLAMRERVESMGGKFLFESVTGRGVTVKASMPFIEKRA